MHHPPGSGTNLPATLTSFVGREHEMQEVIRLLATPRLLTLTGAGGVGKTRLAFAAAAAVVGLYAAGVWVVELAALADPKLVAQAVAAVFGLPEAGGRPILDALIDTVHDRPLLLLLDNCEHLGDACAALCQPLLARCPQLRILATSRQPLAMEGETVWRVPSLSLPEAVPPSGALRECEATALFVDRAAAEPGFAATLENAPAIAEICRRLDGIPLAIELAAPWVKALSAEEIAARLDDRFRLLTGGSRTALLRHQTLRGTLDWSYGLLDEREQVLLRRLAVFEGGWTVEAAEDVCAEDPIARHEILGLLARLVDKSLALAESHARRTRYRLLETTRQYALELLAGSGEAETVGDRHAAYFQTLGERAEPEIFGPGRIEAMQRLDLELDNCRAALRWAVERDGIETELQLIASLWDYMWMRGHLTETQRLVEGALARSTSVASRRALHRPCGARVRASGRSVWRRKASICSESWARPGESSAGSSSWPRRRQRLVSR